MRKLIFISILILSNTITARSYAPYHFQMVNVHSNPILNQDFGLIWKFSKGYVPDSYEKDEDEFFVLSVKNIYDSILYQIRTKELYAVISKEYFQNDDTPINRTVS